MENPNQGNPHPTVERSIRGSDPALRTLLRGRAGTSFDPSTFYGGFGRNNVAGRQSNSGGNNPRQSSQPQFGLPQRIPGGFVNPRGRFHVNGGQGNSRGNNPRPQFGLRYTIPVLPNSSFSRPERRSSSTHGGSVRNDNSNHRSSSTSSEQSHQRRKHSYTENQVKHYNHNLARREHAGNNDDKNYPHARGGARHLGFKYLENLLDKDPENVILELWKNKNGICELLKTNLSDDCIVIFTKILGKVASSAFLDNKYKVLQIYLEDIFLDKLVAYIMHLSIQDSKQVTRNKYFWNDTDSFWTSVISICQDIFDTIPSFACKVAPQILKSLKVGIPAFQAMHDRHVSDEITEAVNKLNEAVQICVKEREEQEKTAAKQKLQQVDYEEPPDDFRLISVYPSSAELIGGRGFLRKNIVQGSYRDVNHYLDVQFRLVREDFVGPLRDGIASYKNRDAKKRVENVRIHKPVRFLNPETVNESYCIRIKFDFSKKIKKISFENSRRFMFGSLLCFTMDNFKSFVFGKIAERKVEDLQKGELIVGFDYNVSVLYDVDYLMVECGVYFEPYYHVLNVLKNMSTDNFPMEKYIIEVDTTLKHPDYLLNEELLDFEIEGDYYDPIKEWPCNQFYNLNEAQLKAFKAALTQEFSVIQGPPGTGKTFLGLKVAKTLLENEELWYNNTPMLVICYTNHALDQFLEGLTEFTDKIVRVGGQSKNEQLRKFNLRNKSRFRVNHAIREQREIVQGHLAQIQNITQNLKQIEMYHSIRAFHVFDEVIPHFHNTWFHHAKRQDILDWLLAGAPVLKTAPRVVFQQEEKGPDEMDVKFEDEDDENDADLFVRDDIFDEGVNVMQVQCSIPLLTLSSLRSEINNLEFALAEIRHKQEVTLEDLLLEEKLTNGLLKNTQDYRYLEFRLAQGRSKPVQPDPPQNVDLKNPKTMLPDDRWALYFHWLYIYKTKLLEKLHLINREFRESYKVYEEMRDIDDTNSMKEVLVVGMTTTCAARLRSCLQTLKSPIVIVEEAAEVLEAHIVTSLTKHCKQLILIGDHKQLKPSTANYSVERFYNLGISLFERMVLNKIQVYSLDIQHRMRPEISSLIAPTIYPTLKDHSSVLDRPPIAGVDKCLFFLNHQEPELDCEGASKINFHEVNFLISFAKHLILNGYKPENITILAAYLGQMFELQRKRKREDLGDVRVAVLDNYQGEECDIILLSLVRNNSANKIGFLSIENRVCVALSRARNGLYIMGNMDQLCKDSELWQNIRKTLEQQNALGDELALRCQVHHSVTLMKTANDFLSVSEGGCNLMCEGELVCGHKCTSLCHPLNRDHIDYKCRDLCRKKLCDTDLHECRKMCYEECGPCYYKVKRDLPCGHTVNLECHLDPNKHSCVTPVTTELPCGHIADKPCHVEAILFRCPHRCEKRVEPCGHACSQNCHIRMDPDHLEYKCKQPCAKYRKGCTVKTEQHLCTRYCYEECDDCLVRVRKHRTVCPHVYDVPCSFDVDSIDCGKPCNKKLKCGHKCSNQCNEPCSSCDAKVEKVIPECGHKIKIKCSEEPSRYLCNKKCPLELKCGHPCTTKCREDCTNLCLVLVDCEVDGPCGHLITKLPCYLTDISKRKDTKLLEYCNQKCSDTLKCGHECSGSCGECLQGRIHKRCSAACGLPLVCNHECTFPCRQACRPCTLKCPLRCTHSVCTKKCGDICTPCKERCPRKCKHQSCTKTCGEICSVPPCEEPCDKLLKCGHACIGFCGDICPPKCLVCDELELTAIEFGNEGQDARYVVLRDCKHVIESTALDTWLNTDNEGIGFKVCPRCKTCIRTTTRYTDYVKRALIDVASVKVKLYGTAKENGEKKKELLDQIKNSKSKFRNLLRLSLKLPIILERIESRLQHVRDKRLQAINKHELNALTSKIQILEHIFEICSKANPTPLETTKEVYVTQISFIVNVLLRDDDYITDQETEDIQQELSRLNRMVEYSIIRKRSKFSSLSDSQTKLLMEQIETSLFASKRLCAESEAFIKDSLKTLEKKLACTIGISETEKREIVKAMGFSKGHWYKCPNGHPYAIADCGGAVMTARCYECKETIGGSSHRLLSSNSVATEMDGATHGAWTEVANMENYNFN